MRACRSYRLIAFAAVTLLWGPAVAAQTYPDTVLYAGVEIRHLVGGAIGHHHAGILRVRQYALTLDEATALQLEETLRTSGLVSLRRGVAPVTGVSGRFAAATDYGTTRFILAGRANFLQVNTYGSRPEVTMAVVWELFDAAHRRVVYTLTTQGEAKPRNNEGVGDILANTLLAQVKNDKAYWAALREPPPAQRRVAVATLPPATATAFRRALPSETDLVTLLPEDRNPPLGETVIERSTGAVFRILGTDGMGTGFLISKDGLALTNHHVIADQSEMRALLPDGQVLAMRVVRADKDADVALVQLACGADCPTLEVEQGPARVVDPLVAIGYPGAADLDEAPSAATQTVTQGIVSALRRQGAVSVIQTDASLNAGNSGGPMLHATSGRVVGIVAWKRVAEATEGIAFGVSIREALMILGVQP